MITTVTGVLFLVKSSPNGIKVHPKAFETVYLKKERKCEPVGGAARKMRGSQK